MKAGKDRSQQLKELRSLAERQISKRVEALRKQPDMDNERLVQELEIHQVELQMQNEELQRAQLELEAARTEYFNLFDLAPIGYFIINEKGLIGKINLTGSEMLGASKIDLVNRAFSHYIHRNCQDKHYLCRRKVLKTGKQHTCELKMLRADRTEFYAKLICIPFADKQGNRNQIKAAMIDITEHKQAELSLKESEEKFKKLAEQSPNMIFINQKGRIVYANKKCEEIMGYTREHFYSPDFDFLSVVAPEDTNLVKSNFNKHLNGEEIPTYEYTLVTKNGNRIKTLISTKLIQYGRGDSILGIITDITEQKKRENQILHLEELERTIVRISSELINTPSSKITQAINNTLKAIGMCTGADRAYLFASHDNYQWIHNTHEWCNKGINPEIENLKHVPATELPEFMSVIKKEMVFHVPSVTDMRKGPQKKHFQQQGIKSLVVIPIVIEKKLVGFVGFDSVKKERRWHESEINALGLVGEMLGNLIERGRAEQELKDSEEKYRSLIESLQEGIWVIDAEACTTFVNQPMADMLGYKIEEMIGKHIFFFMDEKGIEICKKYLEKRKKGKREEHEFEFLRKDGMRIYALIETAPMTDENGNYKGAVAGVIDITYRKKAAAALILRDHAIASSTQGISITDPNQPDNPVIYINQGFEIMTGYKKSEVLGKNMRFLQGPETDKKTLSELRYAIAEGQECKVELLNYRKDGSKLWNRVALTPVFDENSKLINYIAIHTDISESKVAQEKLLEYQNKLKAMTWDILQTEERERLHIAIGLHDTICQKLSIAKASLESTLELVSQPGISGPLKIVCEALGDSIGQTDLLTFDLSNPILKELGFCVALDDYLENEVQNKHGISYELEAEQRLNISPEIRNIIFRISKEIITNIIKHAQASKIKVSVRKASDHIYICINDNGVGFDEKKIDSGKFPKTRFGLFSIREQLASLGGELKIESKSSQGTKITVVIPIKAGTPV